MKNKLIKGLFGLGLGLSAFALTTGVNAMVGTGDFINGGSMGGENLSDRDVSVVVGEVDVPVYNVSVSWTSMQYNYKYNEETYSYEWVVSDACKKLNSYLRDGEYIVPVADKQNAESLYDDAACTIDYTGNIEEEIAGEEVYEKVTGGKIVIGDYSTYGTVTPSITWQQSEGYELVYAKVYYATLNPPTTTYSVEYEEDWYYEEQEELYYNNLYLNYDGTAKILPDTSRIQNKYYLNVALETLATDTGTINPVSGEQIGQITISLSANQ